MIRKNGRFKATSEASVTGLLRWLGLRALAENPGLASSTHWGSAPSVTPVSGISMLPSQALWSPETYTMDHTFRQNTHKFRNFCNKNYVLVEKHQIKVKYLIYIVFMAKLFFLLFKYKFQPYSCERMLSVSNSLRTMWGDSANLPDATSLCLVLLCCRLLNSGFKLLLFCHVGFIGDTCFCFSSCTTPDQNQSLIWNKAIWL